MATRGISKNMNIELGPIIAERTLTAFHSDGSQTTARVMLGKPQIMQGSEFGDFITPYMISVSGVEKTHFMAGIDAFQSLQLALDALAVELRDIERKFNVKLDWEGGKDGDLGFN